jgi:hypothetical protein
MPHGLGGSAPRATTDITAATMVNATRAPEFPPETNIEALQDRGCSKGLYLEIGYAANLTWYFAVLAATRP